MIYYYERRKKNGAMCYLIAEKKTANISTPAGADRAGRAQTMKRKQDISILAC